VTVVVDASALIEALLPDRKPNEIGRRLDQAGVLHAPHLLDVEVANGLRRLVNAGDLSADRAWDVLDETLSLPIRFYPHVALLDRAWELRDNVTLYDGVYLALAEALDAPLVTCDGQLAGIPGHHAQVEVYPRV
jgi:predicted nucleic acid-binding protein